ncbi:MAG: MltA domain-containing protein [Deltaproteobacteria bacterium]|nr:MltA domain-containing protein [Deltaproteobacteria bacterium]
MALAALPLLGACQPVQPPAPSATPEPPGEVRDDLDLNSLRAAVAESLRFLDAVPGERLLGEWPRKVTAEDVRASLTEFVALLDEPPEPDGGWPHRVAERFDFFPAPRSAALDDVLFTGYYQPVIDASPVETSDHRYPVYREPDELRGRRGRARKAAGYSRHDIDVLGTLRDKGYEIAWLRDPVDRFFLHIQGSGLLRMTDGRELPLNFAASNGRRYTSIGKVLIDEGKLDRESMSMQRIRAYLAEFPGEREALFARNERYVFFRLGEEGPLGSLGVPLTAGRSAATDHRFYPKGALLFVETETPVVGERGELAGLRPFVRFVLNQDTGAAIRGPARVDLYFGSGDEAGEQAGYMKSTGRLYLLLKREAAPLN